jgi:predicted outer membrane repeat protein
MKLTFGYLSSFWLSRFAPSLALCVMLSAVRPGLASANFIEVNCKADFCLGLCSLRGAILNHNNQNQGDTDCEAGSSDDTIYIEPSIHSITLIFGPLPAIDHELWIQTPGKCTQIVGSAYLTINGGADVSLTGVGFDADGSSRRSVIENNGGKLSIMPTLNGQGPCRFSNEKKNPPVSGGILVNRNNGTTDISGGNFVNSAADDLGGAIDIESGSVTLESSNSWTWSRITFNNDTADHGGAIYVNNGATLNIASRNFEFSDNRAGSEGGAITSFFGKVNIQPVGGKTLSASFARNHAPTGGAISNYGGQLLSVDGAVFDSNDADNGGAVAESIITPPYLSSITNSYFHDNSAKVNGGAIYADQGSVLNVSRSTFFRDVAGQQGGGIYLDTGTVFDTGHVKVVNSTFLGADNTDGIVVAAGSAEATFSTIAAAMLGTLEGDLGSVHLSNNILRSVICGPGVADEGYNLQWVSAGCPHSIPTGNPKLDPKLLANNGGPTPTIKLLPSSPAIDAIPYADCVDQEDNRVTTDQRGFPRPDREDGPHGPCDIGAFELGSVHAPGRRH